MSQQPKHFYEFGPFRLDTTERLLLRDGHHVPLTPKAFEVLLVLVENGGHVIDKDELIKKVWPNTFVEEVNLAKNVYSLRKILSNGQSEEQYIETIPRRGYRFVAGVKEVWGDQAAPLALEEGALHPSSQSSGLTGTVLGAEANLNIHSEINAEFDSEPGPLSRIEIREQSLEKAGAAAEIRGDLVPLSLSDPSLLGTKFLDVAAFQKQSWLKRMMLGPVGILILASIIGLPLWYMLGRRSSEVGNPYQKIIRVTSFPGREDQPAFSPDGNQVAFVWSGEDESNNDIYVKLIGGEEPVMGVDKPLRLTTNPAADMSPAWSPDGSKIAFIRPSAADAGIFLIPALGGSEQKVADIYPNRPVILGNMLSYSPDGKSLAFPDKQSADESQGIFLVNIATGEKTRMTSPPPGGIGDLSPAFSPDQKTLAFVRFGDISVADLYLVPVTGGEPKRLTFDLASIRGVAWSQDGREIIYSSRREGSIYNFWRVPISGGEPERLMVNEHDVFNGAISRHGDRFIYTRSFLDMNMYRVALNDPAGRSEPPTTLAPSTQDDDSPNYSPDGKKVVFASRRTGNFEIWIYENEGSNLRQLTNMGGPLTGTPRWSPDGRSIVFDSRIKGNSDIYVINADGGKPRRMTDDPAEDITGSWSRDGQWIYFGSTRSGSMQIWKVPAAGGPAVQVTKNGGFEGFESVDGRYLYYAKGRVAPGIWQVPVAGGEETLLLDQHQAGLWRYWTVTDKGIYFATAETSSRPIIEFFNLATRKITHVATLDKPLARTLPGLAISPDGRSLLVVEVEQSNTDIIMVENFR